jgi:hypothetical protein
VAPYAIGQVPDLLRADRILLANPPVDAAIEAPDAAVGAAPLSKAVVVPPAEVFARSRLLLLQTSVDKTVEALRNREQTNP